jgi:selenocysteine-specific elongation factor
VLEELERQLRGTPGDVLGQMLVQLGPTALGRAVELARLSPQGAEEAIEELRKDGRLVWLSPDTGSATGGTDLVAEASVWASLTRRTESILTEHHMAFPLRLGMPREELKSRLGLDARAYSSFLAAAVRQGVVKDVGGRVALSGHQVVLGERAKAGVERLLARFAASPEAPPSYKEALEAVGEEVLAHVIESGVLVQVSAEVLLEGEAYRRMEDRVKQALSGGGTISVAEVRDLFRTSRKYALALMEHLDATGVTVREGDVRRLA